MKRQAFQELNKSGNTLNPSIIEKKLIPSLDEMLMELMDEDIDIRNETPL